MNINDTNICYNDTSIYYNDTQSSTYEKCRGAKNRSTELAGVICSSRGQHEFAHIFFMIMFKGL